uniref:Putative gag protein n=1 Tax=Adineta vaga TaxID=104782 RepID=A1YGT3_ADIVA|nr:putative gag protein [Adineta vaga]
MGESEEHVPTTPSSTSGSAMMICYRECLSNMVKFTGNEEEKIAKFISNIERIGKMINANDDILYCMCTAKIDGEAKRWYENNTSLINWEQLKPALLERFTTPDSSTKIFEQLKERKQRPDESITSFFDTITKLCHDYDPEMSEKMKVSWLENGVKDSLKIPIKRQMKLLAEQARTTKAFLKIAKDEQELQEERVSVPDPTPSYMSYFTNTVSTTKPQAAEGRLNLSSSTHTSLPDGSKNQIYSTTPQSRWSVPKSRSTTFQQYDQSMASRNNKPTTIMKNSMRQRSSCLICKRNNHRSIDCYYKKPTGCYKCGQSDHRIRDCPTVFY